MAHRKTLDSLRNVKLFGYTCPCCRDTGSHMFSLEQNQVGK